MNKLMNCEDCKCNIDGHCFRFPPLPKFSADVWDIERPRTDMDDRGCFDGIHKLVGVPPELNYHIAVRKSNNIIASFKYESDRDDCIVKLREEHPDMGDNYFMSVNTKQ